MFQIVKKKKTGNKGMKVKKDENELVYIIMIRSMLI